ncbi:MAG TPA: cupin domain-containing protein [Flavobacteriales bacterium]|nr:cupin domain-containing protein [Flavobacteriales bacterium]HRE95141.1 cupin domain-containing protein [Flavobacteriales bacterium]
MKPEQTDHTDFFPEKPQGKLVFFNGNAKITRMILQKGSTIPEHTSPVNTYLLVLRGKIQFHINDMDIQINEKEAIEFPGSTTHSVFAFEDSVFLLFR